jgi:hypothetical protein
MENLFSTWVSTPHGNIGIAAIKDSLKNEISIRALPIRGADIKYDKKEIAEWGGRISIKDLKKIIALCENT